MPTGLTSFASASGLRIGVLGGSFNPAHVGHVAVSLTLMKRYKLDYVWWIVSAANPLKEVSSLAPVSLRLASAYRLTHQHSRIIVSNIETEESIIYTADMLKRLVQRFPQHHLIWLMGSDNLAGFHRWHQWKRIATMMPILIYDRPDYTHRACRGVFAARYSQQRSDVICTRNNAPCWVLAGEKHYKISATILRKKLGDHAFLRYNNEEVVT